MNIKLAYATYENCYVSWKTYGNGRPALQIMGADHYPILTASVYMPDESIPPEYIFIKDYSENAGILQSLIDNNIITDTGKTTLTGFVKVHLCKITKKHLKIIASQEESAS